MLELQKDSGHQEGLPLQMRHGQILLKEMCFGFMAGAQRVLQAVQVRSDFGVEETLGGIVLFTR
jgi:hypothetical protein